MAMPLPLFRRMVLRGLFAACASFGAAAIAQPAAAPADCPPTAQAPSAEQVRAGMSAARDHGYLWRIEKNGRRSYLYGTLHVAKLAWMFPGPLVARALDATDTLALELDMQDAGVQQRLADALAESLSASAASKLPESLRRRLARLAEAECLAPLALAGLAPELQLVTLMSLAGRRDGLDPAHGIDLFLSDFGHAARKTVVSLETPAVQLRALLMADATERLSFVERSLDELESGRARPQLARIVQVWAAGDLATLTRYEEWCECMQTPADRSAMARLLDERNPALADGIDALHASGKSVFAAVGSLHMIGAGGLPALLARRGYRVEHITAATP